MSRVFRSGNDIILVSDDGVRYSYNVGMNPIGTGAMGTVYKGINLNTHAPVAIKRVHDQYANNAEVRRRAKQEASMMFLHPNIVEMCAYCETSPMAGPIFIVSNYVTGQTIDKFVSTQFFKRENSVRKICSMFYPVLDALAYIHSKGILHLDIKPSNIMVENGRNVRLMDLGIATITGNIDNGGSGLLGTPRYAAPEQFVDSGSEMRSLNPSTDIYEASVTLYELLTGKTPFCATNLRDSRRSHQNSLPRDKRIPEALMAVLDKAASPNPAERYSTVSEFKRAIEMSFITPPETSFKTWYVVLIVAFLIILIVTILWFR